ncbi:uncharacterized protein LOC134826617 isoform X2 [Bolinopsis microptera]|uniref:uncharacterized protein LOC134826617 isoform X2 n=1 Tax=Bolinopsis microptera TaxID=2820187 RepID=UPI0030791568
MDNGGKEAFTLNSNTKDAPERATNSEVSDQGVKETAGEEEAEETEDDEGDDELLEQELLEREEGEEGEDDAGDEMSGDEENDAPNDDTEKTDKKKKRKNIRKMMNEDELAEETRLEQEREMERIRWLRELHEKSLAEEREKKKFLQEERKKQKSEESTSNQVILLDDDSDHGLGEPQKERKPKKEPTVITLSSDESEPESDKPLTGYDDTTAFVGGMHTDDTKNVTDNQGRVLVNVNHPPDEQDIFLTDKLAKTVKPHQIGGIRFLYDNIIESVSRFNSSPGFGCILAHTMGLGKTLQTISFVDCCLRNTPAHTVLIVVPVNVLQNWCNEFDMWVPKDHTVVGEGSARTYPLYVINDLLKTFQARATLIKKWNETGGVMILGYEMFRLLALTEPSYAVSRKLCRKRRKRGAPVKEVCDIDEEEFYMDLLTATQRSLLYPGPDLIVCDEGHRIKNAHATISKALKKVKTRRRIVLTGYPLQNNLEEYWCMVDFVRPNFLGTKNEFNNMFVRPIENGQCVDSTFKDTQLMKFRSHVLHSLLEGFVQRRDQSILQHTLQSKTEYVLCVKMTPVQRRLLKRFAADMEIDGAVNPIYAFTVLTKIWNHPDVLQEVVASSKIDDLDVDLPKASTKLSLEWAQDELVGMRRGVVEDGAKMVLLLGIIEEAVAIGDKVVVFSQSLLTLSLVEKFLQQRYLPENCSQKNDIRNYFNGGEANPTSGQGPSSPEYPAPKQQRVKWAKNKHYFRLDGSTNSQDRERLIRQFNKKGESALVFLISTRAGSLGVNLIGSNRVIIMDVSWNPCHDAQAVCRIYRYGQTKQSYVYRFVAENTLERTIYNKQITKQGMSSRVVDEQNVEKQFTSSEIVSNADNFEMMPDGPALDHENDWKNTIPEIDDAVLRTVLESHPDLLTAAPFTHESLLLENKNERLTQEEKMLAKKSYQFEKQMNKGFGGFSNTYSKPVNRVTPMCKAAPKSVSGAPCQPLPPIDTSPHWNKNAPTTGVSLEEFAEKYNATNWSPLIKPLSPLQNDDTAPMLFQNIPVNHQEQQIRQQQVQQNFISRPVTSSNSPNIAPKPRSILPAPPTNPQQSFLMGATHAANVQPPPPLKLPLPRLTTHQTHLQPSNPAKRNRKPSKVVSSVRPTQAILAQVEDGKCTYKVPIPRTPETPPSSSRESSSSTPTSSSGKSSITDALRAIDERVIEPPTVSVQRMIEENEILRRQIELDGYFAFSKNNVGTVQVGTPLKSSPGQSSASTTPATTPGLPREDDSKDDLNSTTESKEDDKMEKQKPKKKVAKKTSSSSAQNVQQQQVVYQAIPAQAVQSNQGYQLLIQMPPGGTLPNQTKMVPATQIIQAQPGQQFLNNGTQVINGQPIFIQKQNTPLQLQMPAGSKAVYLMSQPSSVSPQTSQMNQSVTTTAQSYNSTANSTSMDQYIMTPATSQDQSGESASKDVTPESTPSSTASTPQHDVVQQTPPPTLLSPVNYDIQPQIRSSPQLQPQPVLIQQQQPYQQFQYQQQPQYQTYFAGTQMIQPRLMPQQMYMQPSQIQRVQQQPKLKPKPKSAPSKSKSKKPKASEAVQNHMTQAQMHANMLAQQKQRQLTQQMHHQSMSGVFNQRPQLAYRPQQQYYAPVTDPAAAPQHPMKSEPSNCQVASSQASQQSQQRFTNPAYQNHLYQQQQAQYSQYMQQQQMQMFAAKEAEAKKATPSPASKRKSRKKTSDDCDNRVNIQIHSPISFPAEKKQKKMKKAPDCPYSQQSSTTPAVPAPAPVQREQQHVNFAQLHHQQHLYQNMMQMYRQQTPQHQQQGQPQQPPQEQQQQQQAQQQQQQQQQQSQPQQHTPTSMQPHQGYQQLPPHHQHLQAASFQLPTQQQQQQLPPLLYKQYLQKQQPAMQKAAPAPQGHTPLRGAAPQYWGGPQYPQYSQEQSFGFGAPDMGQDEDDRTSSPQSEGEMDVNQFLNIPIKTETREAKGS